MKWLDYEDSEHDSHYETEYGELSFDYNVEVSTLENSMEVILYGLLVSVCYTTHVVSVFSTNFLQSVTMYIFGHPIGRQVSFTERLHWIKSCWRLVHGLCQQWRWVEVWCYFKVFNFFVVVLFLIFILFFFPFGNVFLQRIWA